MRFAGFRFYKRILCLYWFLNPDCCVAQNGLKIDSLSIKPAILEELSDFLPEEVPEDFDYAELTEQMEYYRKHPISLNKTDGTGLLKLGMLSPQQVAAILAYRESSGPFMDVLELQAVPGLDRSLIESVLPLVSVSGNQEGRFRPAKTSGDQRHDLMYRQGRVLPLAEGYRRVGEERSRYLGSPDRMAFRYRYRMDDRLFISLNAKKDAGEPFFREAQAKGFDFYSFSLTWKSTSRLEQVTLGDYVIQHGQGLALWGGLAFGKGGLFAQSARQARGLIPYTSLNETDFFRGIALRYRVAGNLRVTPFVSYRELSATPTLSQDGRAAFSSIRKSGLHRTPNELANRHNLKQLVYGIVMNYETPAFKMDFSTHLLQFDQLASPQPNLYRMYDFRGRSLANGGVSYSWNFRQFYFFGEQAISSAGGLATTNGVIAALSRQWSFIAHYRHFEPDYHSYFSQAVAEIRDARNERGLYAGILFKPNKKWEWTAYSDQFRFPWLRYRTDAPSSGQDLFSQLSFRPDRQRLFRIRYRHRIRGENLSSTDVFATVEAVSRSQLRMEAHYQLGMFSLRSRVEGTAYSKLTQERGILLYQDVFGNVFKGRLNWNARLAWFQTGGFNSRIYAYESNVLYAYSFPFYHGQGWRAYLNTRLRLLKNMDLWLRYASFVYKDQKTVGSGLDESPGPIRTELLTQVRYRF